MALVHRATSGSVRKSDERPLPNGESVWQVGSTKREPETSRGSQNVGGAKTSVRSVCRVAGLRVSIVNGNNVREYRTGGPSWSARAVKRYTGLAPQSKRNKRDRDPSVAGFELHSNQDEDHVFN